MAMRSVSKEEVYLCTLAHFFVHPPAYGTKGQPLDKRQVTRGLATFLLRELKVGVLSHTSRALQGGQSPIGDDAHWQFSKRSCLQLMLSRLRQLAAGLRQRANASEAGMQRVRQTPCSVKLFIHTQQHACRLLGMYQELHACYGDCPAKPTGGTHLWRGHST